MDQLFNFAPKEQNESESVAKQIVELREKCENTHQGFGDMLMNFFSSLPCKQEQHSITRGYACQLTMDNPYSCHVHVTDTSEVTLKSNEANHFDPPAEKRDDASHQRMLSETKLKDTRQTTNEKEDPASDFYAHSQRDPSASYTTGIYAAANCTNTNLDNGSIAATHNTNASSAFLNSTSENHNTKSKHEKEKQNSTHVLADNANKTPNHRPNKKETRSGTSPQKPSREKSNEKHGPSKGRGKERSNYKIAHRRGKVPIKKRPENDRATSKAKNEKQSTIALHDPAKAKESSKLKSEAATSHDPVQSVIDLTNDIIDLTSYASEEELSKLTGPIESQRTATITEKANSQANPTVDSQVNLQANKPSKKQRDRKTKHPSTINITDDLSKLLPSELAITGEVMPSELSIKKWRPRSVCAITMAKSDESSLEKGRPMSVPNIALDDLDQSFREVIAKSANLKKESSKLAAPRRRDGSSKHKKSSAGRQKSSGIEDFETGAIKDVDKSQKKGRALPKKESPEKESAEKSPAEKESAAKAKLERAALKRAKLERAALKRAAAEKAAAERAATEKAAVKKKKSRNSSSELLQKSPIIIDKTDKQPKNVSLHSQIPESQRPESCPVIMTSKEESLEVNNAKSPPRNRAWNPTPSWLKETKPSKMKQMETPKEYDNIRQVSSMVNFWDNVPKIAPQKPSLEKPKIQELIMEENAVRNFYERAEKDQSTQSDADVWEGEHLNKKIQSGKGRKPSKEARAHARRLDQSQKDAVALEEEYLAYKNSETARDVESVAESRAFAQKVEVLFKPWDDVAQKESVEVSALK